MFVYVTRVSQNIAYASMIMMDIKLYRDNGRATDVVIVELVDFILTG